MNEDFVEPTVNAIIQAGRSGPDGKIGDGKIFILPWTTASGSGPASAGPRRSDPRSKSSSPPTGFELGGRRARFGSSPPLDSDTLCPFLGLLVATWATQ